MEDSAVSYQIVPLYYLACHQHVSHWIKTFLCASLLKREMDTFVDRDKAGWGSKVVTLHSRQRPIYNVSQSFWSFQHFSRNDIWHKLPFACLSIIIKQNLNFKECFDQIPIKNRLEQKCIIFRVYFVTLFVLEIYLIYLQSRK